MLSVWNCTDDGLYMNDAAGLAACVEQTLQWDIRSHSQRAQKIDSFSVLLDGVRFRFRIDLAAAAITVESCTLETHASDVPAPAAAATAAVAEEDKVDGIAS